MLYFTALYADRKAIMDLGGLWDFSRWAWRVDKCENYVKFSRWLPNSTVSDKLYILEAHMPCPACGKRVKPVALAVGEYRERLDSELIGADCVNILYGFDGVPDALYLRLAAKYKLRRRYIAEAGLKLSVNCCPHCDAPITDEYLFIEPSSPFFIDSKENADELDVYCLKLEFDYAFGAIVTRAVDRSLFTKEFKQITDIKLF